MAKRIWEIDLDGNKHRVELTHGYVSGKIEIHLDGNKIEIPKSELPKLLEFGSKHQFTIGGHPGQILIGFDGSSYVYHLFVDGQPVMQGVVENRQQQEEAQAEFNRLRNIASALFVILLGIVAFWFNWNSAHTRGIFSEKMALISPLPVIFGLYVFLFPNDISKFSTNAVVRLIIVMVIALSLGYANRYALLNGFY